jgi:hypothetical protein
VASSQIGSLQPLMKPRPARSGFLFSSPVIQKERSLTRGQHFGNSSSYPPKHSTNTTNQAEIAAKEQAGPNHKTRLASFAFQCKFVEKL